MNGKRQGTGTFLYANGDVYTGQWLNDMKQGQGVYTYSATKTSVRITNIEFSLLILTCRKTEHGWKTYFKVAVQSITPTTP